MLRSVDDVERLGDVSQSPSIGAAVDAMREFLGMDVAYAAEMTDAEQILRVLRGDGESFGVGEGMAMPLEATYCRRILEGRLPNINPDIRADPRAASMPVTESAGVGAFVSVPLRFSDGQLFGTLCAANHDARPDLGYRELQFLHVFARIAADQLERDAMLERAQSLQAAAARTLVAAVAARDSYTAEHSRDVVDHAVATARHLDLSEEETIRVELVALLHDIGKIATSDAILRKAGPLTDAEWEIMREHPIEAERLILKTPGLEHLAPMVRAEHERWDGSGYPDGLSGEGIPIVSRITLACDAYHAMTSDRPYRSAMAPEDAQAEMVANSGSQFDPEVVETLLATLG